MVHISVDPYSVVGPHVVELRGFISLLSFGLPSREKVPLVFVSLGSIPEAMACSPELNDGIWDPLRA